MLAIRTLENISPHPYLFFNADSQTFTFLGFYINNFGDLVDIHSNEVLEKRIMSRTLFRALLQNGVPIKEDFDSLQRKDKIERLCRVIGVDKYDQRVYDETYELTTDNCKKMLAVYMRFRCGIPVIIMGETGCGKTRLVTFLCEIMVPRDKDTQEPLTTNMIIMKVHGGVTNEDIKSKVWNAERIAVENIEKYGENVYTVLFFDEANTTESIGLIKEIMCDKTMEGKPLNCKNLKFVAACNPYRKYPKEVITKLEKAGLGYHVKAIQTKDRFGRIPMRRLVYRVQPLPQSLLPFVWDFGQLSTAVENLYIRHMVRRYMVQNGTESIRVQLPNDEQLLEVISSILTQSQEYMRSLKDECSFVSLRDVDRVLQVMCWFYSMSKDRRTLFQLADEKLRERNQDQKLTDITRSLLLALAVCYHSSLSQRTNYWKYISQFFRMPCEIYGGYINILDEIDRVQEVFLDSVNLEDNSNIARNHALKENVFMMVVCIELRIPLFLVGKPGSSKSLAKVIVTDAMQGQAAKKALFKEMKQVQMVSFQCSPLTSPEAIISTFHQCASFQQNYKDNLDKFVSVVVLDEIGLAEDSERMPLKTLHPLLEDGCQGDEIAEQYNKVAFIGISNWSLDPAKMNRGVFVQGQVPDLLELEKTARGICASTQHVNNLLIKPLSFGYLEVFKKASEEKREFFGLRDFYSLMKMINQIVLRSKQSYLPTYIKLRFAVRRNFSGLDNFDTFKIFIRQLTHFDEKKERQEHDPDDSFTGLLKSWITNEYSDSRHLLLLTENYSSAIAMFEQAFLTKTKIQPIVIFGGSFRRDQEYTQICRNINKIKICMETGKLVILVNSDNLYESLYDALNQYYVYFGGERYVDLGFGTHRVKCPVHKDFKLIVVAEKQTVYERFPIPLINRLEKHCLMSTALLNEYQKRLARSLKEWIEGVTKQSLSLRNRATENDVAKVFIGYHHDVCAILALETWTDEMSLETVDHWDKVILWDAS
ncbi:E3 ubiquitin-protein ligase rnf213-alpha-like [Ruditapes philippinarum]|uniref:E3 ubiquitin-protein ligase rnf213-alpha-like n=1 Tax=Ruditapes philippinarum TaxID=129788 RepID=UPI00295A6699|nr:E3 ubiquitin-protein ligase rnf213-alpha-like [Ruditapes philippinarum]